CALIFSANTTTGTGKSFRIDSPARSLKTCPSPRASTRSFFIDCSLVAADWLHSAPTRPADARATPDRRAVRHHDDAGECKRHRATNAYIAAPMPARRRMLETTNAPRKSEFVQTS